MSDITNKPILFLDIDDVICFNDPYGGYNAFLAVNDLNNKRQNAIWKELFNKKAVSYLKQLIVENDFQIVLSTSWKDLFSKDDLIKVLNNCGLEFITGRIHNSWCTPYIHNGSRGEEIYQWLDANPTDSFVILDDEHSGKDWDHNKHKNAVLCKVGKGLGQSEYDQINSYLSVQL